MKNFLLWSIAVATATYLAYWGYFSRDAKILRFCEKRIESELASPSSYVRHDVSYFSGPIERSDYEQVITHQLESGRLIKFALNEYDSSKDKPIKTGYRISFDAKNLYGTPIRSAVTCSFLAEYRYSPLSPSELSVVFD